MREIQPIKNKRNPTLVVDSNDDVHQKFFHDAGVQAINWGMGSKQNTIPTGSVPGFEGRRSNLANLGRQWDLMGSNSRALLDYAKSTGNLQHWSDWYNEANGVSRSLSKTHRINSRTASGVLAALSGNGGEWGTNKINADKVISAFKEGNPITDISSLKGIEEGRLGKAHAILAGGDPREVLGDAKEGNFFENIENPSNPNAVTVDTHMYHGLTGWKRPWKSGTPGLADSRVYHFMSGVIHDAGKDFGLDPNAAQAGMWEAIKDLSAKQGGVHGTPPPQHSAFDLHYLRTDMPEKFQ